MSRAIDITGQRFGKLIVIERVGTAQKGETLWKCKCDCGNEVVVRRTNLRTGHTRSCGCFHDECSKTNSLKHGMTGTRLNRIWKNMKDRCSKSAKGTWRGRNYADRGISVCEEWKDFQAFAKWAMENGYQDNLTLDRIDPNGNYEPNNCRWATTKEQANNKRTSRFVEYQGERYTVSELAETIGISKRTLITRLNNGWSVEDAISRPIRLRTKGYRPSGARMKGADDE